MRKVSLALSGMKALTSSKLKNSTFNTNPNRRTSMTVTPGLMTKTSNVMNQFRRKSSILKSVVKWRRKSSLNNVCHNIYIFIL